MAKSSVIVEFVPDMEDVNTVSEDQVVDSEAEDVEEDEDVTDVLVDEMTTEWSDTPDDDGIIIVRVSGTYVFHVHEVVNEDGTIEYTSGLFKNKQDELGKALRLSIGNVAKRVFKRQWETLFPPEAKVRRTRQSVRAELDVRDRQMEVVLAALESGRPVTAQDFIDAGVPVHEKFSQLSLTD